ncbi:unnamed protein product [Cuscuta epithymum]|uniref:Uncharacterized protein n=1 Tax=Cuscuta epithymum TaxID=186058 RepID=A0AAV0F5A1_9ASTE|nr:unnamed protein product [Cuscuta epithymum]
MVAVIRSLKNSCYERQEDDHHLEDKYIHFECLDSEDDDDDKEPELEYDEGNNDNDNNNNQDDEVASDWEPTNDPQRDSDGEDDIGDDREAFISSGHGFHNYGAGDIGYDDADMANVDDHHADDDDDEEEEGEEDDNEEED